MWCARQLCFAKGQHKNDQHQARYYLTNPNKQEGRKMKHGYPQGKVRGAPYDADGSKRKVGE